MENKKLRGTMNRQVFITKNVLLSLVVLIFIVFSCGIDTYNALESIPYVVAPDTDSVIFSPVKSGDTINPEYLYLGIDIFYRLYDSQESASNDRTAFLSRQDSEVVPGTSISSYLASRTGLNYYRILHLENGTELFLDAATDIELDSLLTIRWDTFLKELSISGLKDQQTIILARNKSGSSIPFSQKPVIGDIDYTSNNGTGLYLQLFAASSAFVFSANPQLLYSKAVHLITMQID